MLVVSVVSTKGGEGKTTTTANVGAISADAGLRVLGIDIGTQPGLSSYYPIIDKAECGIFEFIAYNERSLDKLISRTSIQNFDLIYSNDPKDQLNTMLLHAPDGRLRLRNLLPIFSNYYDVVLIDTQGARSAMLEMTVLASDKVISPITPDMLSAREFKRGTVQLIEDVLPFENLGIKIPTINLLFNCVPTVSSDAKAIEDTVRKFFSNDERVSLMNTTIPMLAVYKKAASKLAPAHRLERRQPSNRSAPSALETMKTLICEMFPQWQEQFMAVDGKKR